MENKKNDTTKEDTTQKEIGGVKNYDPTKYGDWQHKGKVSDF